MQKIRRKVAILIKYHSINRKDRTSVINHLTKFNKGRDSPRFHKSGTVWFCQEVMSDPDVVTIKILLALTPRDRNGGERPIMSYPGVVKLFLNRESPDALTVAGRRGTLQL